MMRLTCAGQIAVGLLVLCAAADCGGGKDKSGGGSDKSSASHAPQPKAVVEGVVRLAEGAELPAYTRAQMEKKVLRALAPEAAPAACTPPKLSDRQPVKLTPDGLLVGVMLAPSGFSHQQQRPPLVHEVTIEDCRLTPSLVVAMKGDSLRVRNTVDYPFMPSYDQGPMVRSLIPGQTYDVPLNKPGVLPLLCGFTAPCGRTDVVVLLHPIYAVTDEHGKFRFDDFPAGEKVSLSAWHPLFKETKIELQVEPGEHKQLELVMTPAPQAPEPAEPEVPAKPGKKAQKAKGGKAPATAPAAAKPAATRPAAKPAP